MELELGESETQIQRGGCFNEDGVEGTHNILEETHRGVEDLHGACRGGGEGDGKKWRMEEEVL